MSSSTPTTEKDNDGGGAHPTELPPVSEGAIRECLAASWGPQFRLGKLLKASQNYTYLGYYCDNKDNTDCEEVEVDLESLGAADKFVVRVVADADKHRARIATECNLLAYVGAHAAENGGLKTCKLIEPNSSSSAGNGEEADRKLFVVATEKLQVRRPQQQASEREDEKEGGEGELVDVERQFCMLLLTFAEGRPVDFVSWEGMTNKGIVVAMGAWLGRFHSMMRPREAAGTPATQHDDGALDHIREHVRPWTALHDRLMEEAPVDPRDAAMATNPRLFGILHGDLNVSNIHLIERPSSDQKTECEYECDVFDWDQVQLGWFAYDLALPLHGAHMLQLGGSPFAPGHPDIGVHNYDEFKEWLISGYEEATRAAAGEESADCDFKVDREHLDRMVALRQSFYLRFAERELAAPSLPPAMVEFCRYIQAYGEKVKQLQKEKVDVESAC